MQLAKKQIALVAHFFLLTKRKFARAARIFVFLCRCFAWLQRCFERLQRQWLPSYTVFLWREELSYVLTQYFVSRLHVRFYFSLALIYTLLAASISHFLTAALNFHVFLPTEFVSFVFNHLLKLFLCYPLECKHQKYRRKRHGLVVVFSF